MKAHWWSCVLGLLCMPGEVILNTWTVSQNPSSISYMRVNSSAKITCSTSLSDPLGLYLYREFHRKKNIVYLSLTKGSITKNTTSEEFAGKIQATPDKHTKGYGITLRLSLLGLDDTDLYYCKWEHFDLDKVKQESLSTNGTIIIVRDYDPEEQCKDQFLDHMLIFLSVIAFIVVVFIAFGALILKCRPFKKRTFRPNGYVPTSNPNRPEDVYPQHQHWYHPYMTTTTSEVALNMRDIL